MAAAYLLSDDVRAAGSSVDTQRFIAKGASVRSRICSTTSTIRSGAMPCAPNEPRPPALETHATRLGDESPPPKGPCTMGYRRLSRRVALVSCHIRAPLRFTTADRTGKCICYIRLRTARPEPP